MNTRLGLRSAAATPAHARAREPEPTRPLNADARDAWTKIEDRMAASALPATTRTLLAAMFARRSQRFATGGEMPGGKANPLAFKSAVAPMPLTLNEEAAIAMSAIAITGYANAELPLHSGPDGNGGVLTTLVGRAVASPDAAHSVALFVINDEGVWFVRRPQNLSEAEVREQLRLLGEGKVVEAYQALRVKIADGRRGVPRNTQHTPSFNIWDHNRPGTTVFLPVMDLSTIYLAAMTTAFNKDSAFNISDEHANYALAGTAAFGQSKGGELNDKLTSGRLYPLDVMETFVDRMATIELGEMVAHMALVGS
ncbi:MAG: hypothetical protein ACAI38_01690, partial [Myxococcota bacterium]